MEILLQMFGLDPTFHRRMDLEDIMDVPHHHLKTVCITGFCGNDGQVELAKYIIKNALILEHLTLKLGGDKGSLGLAVDELYGRKEAEGKLAPLARDGVLTIF
jgi:hypothetical protein